MLGLIQKMFMVLLSNIINASKHTKCVSLSTQKCEIQPFLTNLHPNQTVKNFITIDFQLNYIDVLEVAILLIIYLIKYVFQIKQKI